LGKGWNLTLSQYVPSTRALSLHTNESFIVTGGGATPAIREKKLDSFHFHDELDGINYRVVHRSGLVECLQVITSNRVQVALPHRVYAPSGHWIELKYEGKYFEHVCLSEIVDSTGQLLLRVDYSNPSLIKLHLHPQAGPDGSPLATYQLHLTDREMRVIELPTEDKASWRLSYENSPATQHMTCLKTIETPTGSRETLTYDDAGHRLPNGAPVQRLPRIDTHELDPGFGQPVMKTRYTYSAENFLGANGGLTWTQGEDNLYNAPADYVFTVTANEYDGAEVRRKTHYQYNRHHLLTLQTTEQYGEVLQFEDQGGGDDTVKMDWHVHKIHTVYHELPGVPFDLQPAYFQMAKTVTQSWEMSSTDDNRYHEEVTTTNFDDFGNQIEERQPNGIRVVNEYYPVQGEEGGCPPDPHGFTRTLKRTITYPATGGDVEPGAPILVADHRYAAVESVIARTHPLRARAAEYAIFKIHEQLGEGVGAQYQLLTQTDIEPFLDPADLLRHGRILRQALSINGLQTITDFIYTRLPSTLEHEAVLQTQQTLTGFDHDEPLQGGGRRDARKTITTCHSMLTGEALLNRDDNDVEIAYEYDALRRVTRETVAPNDPQYTASRHYGYFLVNSAGQQASQTTTDVKGVVTHILVDGLNRVVLTQRQDADAQTAAQREALRTNYSAVFDVFGNLVKQVQYDWLEEDDLALESNYLFDAWNQQYCEIGPDQTKQYTVTDMFDSALSGTLRTQTDWRESASGKLSTGKTIQWRDVSGNTVREQRVDTKGGQVSLHRYFYDGLGRKAREMDAALAEQRFVYDAFDRLLEHTLGDKNTVSRQYALHSTEDLPTRISVAGKLLGEQHFDGLGRLIQSITGGRSRTLRYEPGQNNPRWVTTPKGVEIEYSYAPQLSGEPLQRRAEGVTADYEYDALNARLKVCVEQGQMVSREYFSTGELKQEIRKIGGDAQYEMFYRKSLLARDLSYTDVLGNVQTYTYDLAGRLEQTYLGSTTASFSHDELGRVESITTVDGDQWLTTRLMYDDFDREVMRIFEMPGETQWLVQEYDGMDRAKRRHLQDATDPEALQTLRDETYEYDDRGRLTVYSCEGRLSPVDAYGKVIRQQLFDFDEVDNITFVTTFFPNADGNRLERNYATYSFDNPLDPAQLTKISNSHADYDPGQPIELLYDADGNLIRDEQQRTLSYDAFGRLVNVKLPVGDAVNYSYDPLDRLAGQMSETFEE
uniref:RHS repeat domain-containing protein n=2 Tax=Pseudomonas TaxID=286 RepID=UPI000761F821